MNKEKKPKWEPSHQYVFYDETETLDIDYDKPLSIYTDGGARMRTRFGAWAFNVVQGGKIIYCSSGGYEQTTCNHMELMAIKKAYSWLKDNNIKKANILSDSQYSVNALTQWRYGWERRGWKTSYGAPVKNKELILGIVDLMKSQYTLKWIRGKANNEYQHVSHVLCDDAIDRLQRYRTPIIVNTEHCTKEEFVNLENMRRDGTIPDNKTSILFKKVFNITPEMNNNFVRLMEAKKLAEETDLPTSEIASLIGYESTQYFAVLLKKKFGKTITELRMR